MTELQKLLTSYRQASASEREKGTYFEDLICTYLRNEATYRDLYDKIWTYADWAREQKMDARDTGIDLVAQTHSAKEVRPMQQSRSGRGAAQYRVFTASALTGGIIFFALIIHFTFVRRPVLFKAVSNKS